MKELALMMMIVIVVVTGMVLHLIIYQTFLPQMEMG